jgi:GNAT superfamily N-acetyltransferase
MQVEVRTIRESEASEASRVIHASFALVASHWDPQAREDFLARSAPSALAVELTKAAYAAAAFDGDKMRGLILMPNPSLLGLLFVHPEALRQGIGKVLWERARCYIEVQHPAVHTIELNATPNAVAFYRSAGFVPLSAEFTHRGARATRMACWLPARGLGAECST